MEQYKVKILPQAQKDLAELVDYLNTLSPQAALRYYDLLTTKIAGLSQLPERCPPARDAQLRLRGYRFLVVESYVVFFVIIGEVVQVRRILYYRRQYQSFL